MLHFRVDRLATFRHVPRPSTHLAFKNRAERMGANVIRAGHDTVLTVGRVYPLTHSDASVDSGADRASHRLSQPANPSGGA